MTNNRLHHLAETLLLKEKGGPGIFRETSTKGEVGRKEEVGEKGSKGNAAEVEELQQHLSDRIDGRLDCWIVLTFLTQKKRRFGSAASIMCVTS